MTRPPIRDGLSQAARRPLKIFAADPMLGRTLGNRARIDVANERLTSGPVGARVEVIGYDGAQKCFYSPVNLDHEAILMQGGLEPSESDPRFHQQMVYAVAMKTLENFDRALGRVLRLGAQDRKRGTSYPRLRLFPHAFHGANAFYSPKLNAVLFGYFTADADDPGPNLPGQQWRDLLTRTAFYKIGHQGSHNATPKDFVETTMPAGILAMASTLTRDIWPDIPRIPLLEALERRQVKVARSDEPTGVPFSVDAGVVEATIPL